MLTGKSMNTMAIDINTRHIDVIFANKDEYTLVTVVIPFITDSNSPAISRVSTKLMKLAKSYKVKVLATEMMNSALASRLPPSKSGWKYIDLTDSIIKFAEDVGLIVVKVDPRFTSRRCARCHCVAHVGVKEDNFFCFNCRFIIPKHFNACLNILQEATRDLVFEKKSTGEHCIAAWEIRPNPTVIQESVV